MSRTRTIDVLVAEGNALERAGLRLLLAGIPRVRVVGLARDGRQALKLARDRKPDVALVDLVLPGLGGLQALSLIRKAAPAARIVVCSVHAAPAYVRQALRRGAAGFLLKEDAESNLARVIAAVGRGAIYLSPGIPKTLLKSTGPPPAGPGLTPRQREILRHIADGRHTKQMAAMLHISAKTVETHRSHLMTRLGIFSIPELVRYAVRTGVVRA